MSRLAPLRLVTSPTHLYKKLDEFGEGYDLQVKEMVESDTKWFAEKIAMEKETEPRPTTVTCAKPSPGFKLTIDNVDYHQNVHYMTEEHQNIDRHYVTVNATTNRISGNHLSTDSPVPGIKQMENGKCIPNHIEQKVQRANYITLVQRILVENIPCLEFGQDVVEKHIHHKYSKEASQPTNSVSL
jgi:hypothetical protein